MNADRLPWFACRPSALLGAIAGMEPHEGYVYCIVLLRVYEVGGPIADDDRALARRTGLNARKVTDAVTRLCRNGKLYRTNDGRLMNPAAEAEIAAAKLLSETNFDNRKKGWEKRKQNQRGDSLKSDDPLPKSDTDQVNGSPHLHLHKQEERKKDIRAVACATRPEIEARFADFWKAYPRRDGANPKAPALKKFTAAIRSGADPEAIITGAKRYASEEGAKGKIGTPYIAQAVTWLGQSRWQDYPAPSAEPALIHIVPRTPQWDAWRAHRAERGEPLGYFDAQGRAEGGKYSVPSEWPPGHPANQGNGASHDTPRGDPVAGNSDHLLAGL